MKRMTMVLMVVLVASVAAVADWQPGQPAKWVQLPDLSTNGVDVLATNPKVLADDFLCTTPEPITDIHIWGSWLQDILPINPNTGVADPHAVGFRLSIHSDIPATEDPVGNPIHSRPGDLLWERFFEPGEFAAVRYAEVPNGEGFYNPNTGEYFWPADYQVWQYNFIMDPASGANVFKQEGTPDNPIVYWLDVQAYPVIEPGTVTPVFGWKTSREHWNDDAVWLDSPTSIPDWQELRYPSTHPYGGESIDLAFAITPEPATLALMGLGLLGLLRRRR